MSSSTRFWVRRRCHEFASSRTSTPVSGPRTRPPPPAAHPKGRQVDPAGARRSAGAADRPAAPARSADRASASDPGPLRPSVRRASHRARRRDEDGADRGLRGRDVLFAFRRGEGRRRRRRPITVRVCDSLSCAMAGAETLLAELPDMLGKDVRVVRAPCMGACDRAPVCAVGHVQTFRPTPDKVAAAVKAEPHAHAWQRAHRFRRLSEGRRLCAAEGLPRRQAHARRTDQDRQRCRPARPRRRRLSDRAQMVAGARRAGAAHVRGQCRRRRARHLQGPLLSRARSAPLSSKAC